MDEQVATILRGYARASDFLEKERIRRLKKMSVAESRAIFDELLAVRQVQIPEEAESDPFFHWRLEAHVSLRRSFIDLAKARGWL